MKKPSLRWLLLLVTVSSCSTDTGPKTGNPGPPAKLSVSQQPTNAVKDTAFVNPIKVQLLDQNGDLTTATDNVTLALGVNPKNAHVTGTLTVAAVSGVATFPGLKLDSVGTGYRLVATSGALPADTSAAFAVTLSLKDFDGDGYSPNQGDCNDADSTVHPNAVDFPDPNHVDANCDGIDGDKSVAVFVATTGFDSAGCGTMAQPCQSVKQGVVVAQSGGKRDVYVAAGAYAGFTAADGINVFGGFDATWARSSANLVTLTGHMQTVPGFPDSLAVTVVANGLTHQTILSDLTMVGGTAAGTDTTGTGRSSYVVLAHNVTGPGLLVLRSHLILGHGANGAKGAAGVDADSLSPGSAMNGGTGADGAQYSSPCDNTNFGTGGSAGTNASAGTSAGGKGGKGGTMDANCNPITPDFNATSGTQGDSAQIVAVGFGHGGAGGLGQTQCAATGAGQPGLITNGVAGAGGTGNGKLSSGLWVGASGDSGGVGANGGGGGGGGGAGGCDNGTDSYGAGGGGGGAGGMAAVSGGRGGGAGGGAFGIYVLDAVVIANADTIAGGTGGTGGAGGDGGQGQSGGAGGLVGAHPNGAIAGLGGAGGHGGHAGGGGGGAGGVVYGIYVATAGSTLTNTGNVFGPGAGGAGGTGGISAPKAPAAERDGHNGTNGATGAVGSAGSCSAPSGC